MNRYYDFFQVFVTPILKLFYPLRVEGMENPPKGGAIIAPTHSSNLDPVMMVMAMPRKIPTKAMAKDGLFRVFFVGWYIRKAGAFPVSRETTDVAAIKNAMQALKSNHNLLMFPEGTRVNYPGELQAKGGVAMIAIRTGAQLVPVYVEDKKKVFKPTRIVVGEPYTPTYSGRSGTPEEVQAAADELLRRAYALGGITI